MSNHDRNWPVRDRNGKIRKLKDCSNWLLENSIKALGNSYQRVYLQALIFYAAVWHRRGVQHYGGMYETEAHLVESLDELKIRKILEYPARYEAQSYTAISNMTGSGLVSELSRLMEKSLPSLEHQLRLYRTELESRGEDSMQHPASFWENEIEDWLAQRRAWAFQNFSAQYLNE